MVEPQLKSLLCASPAGLHRLCYWEWAARQNSENAPAVVCVHGLTRNGRDFDALAAHLSRRWRVICPDMAGRGRSDPLAQSALYGVPQYVADCVSLIARLNVEKVAWVGTSMGGLIGMSLAALKGTPISRLVLNDVGPELSVEGLARIGDYVGKAPDFGSYEECVRYTKSIAAGFGPHDDAGWDLLSRHYWVRKGDRWRVHYDPRIAEPFAEAARHGPVSLWSLYDAVSAPTLLIRGAQSDVLTSMVASDMTRRGPQAKLVEFEGVGHAPSLIAPDQIHSVESFLEET